MESCKTLVSFATKYYQERCHPRYINSFSKIQMRNLASFLLPSILGLVAGIGHGITSHNQDLPFSLADQVVESVSSQHFSN